MQETESIDEYILQHIDPESDYLKSLYRDTCKTAPSSYGFRAFAGTDAENVCRNDSPRQILEIGTYSGYSALCLAEGLVPKVECCIRLRSMMNKRILPVHGWKNHHLPIKFVLYR